MQAKNKFIGMRELRRAAMLLGALVLLEGTQARAIPFTLSYQGQIVVDDARFEGTGQFKFALVDGAGASLWSHDLTSAGGAEPTSFISLPVVRGVYQARLGDTGVANMAAINPAIFVNDVIRLRVWFNDGVNGFQQLTPDSEVASVAFAMRAGVADTVAPGAIDLSQFSTSLMTAFTDLQTQVATLKTDVENTALASVTAVSSDPVDPALLALGYQLFLTTDPAPWISGETAGAPSARDGAASVWTGSKFIVWGGSTTLGGTDSGSIYDPAENNWRPVLAVDQPGKRSHHSAVWNGFEMFVWGGLDAAYLDTGGRYDLALKRWTTITTTGAPEARARHIAAWAGNRMLIWGGQSVAGPLGDGALYDPAANSWAPLALPGAPSARFDAAAVWAGDRLIIWGGDDALTKNTGAQLIFAGNIPDRWAPITTTGAPAARSLHTMVWTGTRMIVWGGQSAGNPLATGAAYDPLTDTWTLISNVGAPGARDLHSAVWTGTEMLIIGGRTSTGATASGFAYNPAKDQWRALSNLGVQQSRYDAEAAWTGTRYVTFGGNNGSAKLAAVVLLEPKPVFHLFRK
jgi:hypothetical protein